MTTMRGGRAAAGKHLPAGTDAGKHLPAGTDAGKCRLN
jgi:hypothetical protein